MLPIFVLACLAGLPSPRAGAAAGGPRAATERGWDWICVESGRMVPGAYYVQVAVGALSDMAKTLEYATHMLADPTVPVRCVQAREGGRAVYEVRIGPFGGSAEAAAVRARLDGKGFKAGVFRPEAERIAAGTAQRPPGGDKVPDKVPVVAQAPEVLMTETAKRRWLEANARASAEAMEQRRRAETEPPQAKARADEADAALEAVTPIRQETQAPKALASRDSAEALAPAAAPGAETVVARPADEESGGGSSAAGSAVAAAAPVAASTDEAPVRSADNSGGRVAGNKAEAVPALVVATGGRPVAPGRCVTVDEAAERRPLPAVYAGVFPSIEGAYAEAKRVTAVAGHPADCVILKKSAGARYAVRIGGFPASGEARVVQERLRRKGFPAALAGEAG